jgi:hypothetical protein
VLGEERDKGFDSYHGNKKSNDIPNNQDRKVGRGKRVNVMDQLIQRSGKHCRYSQKKGKFGSMFPA